MLPQKFLAVIINLAPDKIVVVTKADADIYRAIINFPFFDYT